LGQYRKSPRRSLYVQKRIMSPAKNEMVRSPSIEVRSAMVKNLLITCERESVNKHKKVALLAVGELRMNP